jgi:tetratricopeptide (TPR) repeat protein
LSGIFDRDYLFSLACFVFSLASKVIAVTLPLALITMDLYYKRTKNPRIILLEKLPFFLLSIVASLAMTFVLTTRGPLLQATFLTRITVGINSIISYLFKLILPLNLNPFYPFPQNVSPFSLQYFVPIILTLGITVSLLALYKRRRFLLAAWACYVFTLLPVIGIIHVGMESMADRYFYLPSVMPILTAGVAFGLVSERVNVAKQNILLQRVTLSASVLLILFPLTYITIKQIGVWKNSIALWNYVIENTQHQNFQRNPTAFINRGVAYSDAGNYDKAFKDFTRAIAVNPNYYGAYYYRGRVSLGQGLTDRAIDDFSKAIALNPRYYEAINYRAKIYHAKGLTGKAIDDFSKVIALDPYNYEAFYNRGISYGQVGALDKAIEDFSRALSINRGFYEAYCYLGYAYYSQSKYDMAIKNYNKAIELNSDKVPAYINRAYAWLKTGDTGNAIADLRRGCGLGSDVGCRELKILVKD